MRHRPQPGDLGASIETFGEDFAAFPADCWGRRDWAQVEARYQSLGETLPAPAPARVLPTGFSLYPDRQRAPLTKGQRAVAEIRASKLGSRR
jgi:hypothetical protein